MDMDERFVDFADHIIYDSLKVAESAATILGYDHISRPINDLRATIADEAHQRAKDRRKSE